jgi:hypothetical protein
MFYLTLIIYSAGLLPHLSIFMSSEKIDIEVHRRLAGIVNNQLAITCNYRWTSKQSIYYFFYFLSQWFGNRLFIYHNSILVDPIKYGSCPYDYVQFLLLCKEQTYLNISVYNYNIFSIYFFVIKMLLTQYNISTTSFKRKYFKDLSCGGFIFYKKSYYPNIPIYVIMEILRKISQQ